MYLIKSILFYASFLISNDDISFVRFYANESDYIADIRLLATQRFSQSHMQVFYTDQKIPLLKEWLDEKGETIKWEVLDYKDKRLIRRYFLNLDQNPDSLIQFGQDEPWSIEFRKSFDSRNREYYEGQESKFILNEASQINLIHFINVQGKLYGEIDFIYDHLGLLIGEVWREFPSQKIVRRFAYSTDMLTMKKAIWEYDKNGQEISHVVLAQTHADKLYKTLPPRFGNRLDEISVLLEDIRSRDIKVPFDVFIPKTDYDLMILTNNDSLMVEVIELGQQRITFKIVGESDQLTIPKFRVQSITSKYGERIFP